MVFKLKSNTNHSRSILTISTLFRIILLLVLPVSMYAQEYINMPLALYIEGQYTDEVPAAISETQSGTQVKLDSSKLFSQLKPFLAEKARPTIQNMTQNDWITLSEIKEAGIEASFDSSQLRVQLHVPPEMKPPHIIKLKKGHSAGRDYTLSSAPFSAYLNTYANADIVYENYNDEHDFEFPLVFTLSPSFNIYQWVLESSSRFYTHKQPFAEIDYLRLLHDFPQQGLRLVAGTIDTPSQGGLLTPTAIDGVTVGTLPVLKEIFSSYSPSSKTIMLEQPATVSIYLNGRLLRQLQLKPGVHELLDFPYIGGLNEIKITIKLQDGEERTVRTLVPFDSRLLEPGEWSYAAGAGTPQHSFEDPLASAIAEYGITESITGGIQAQASLENYTGTAHSLFTTPIGNFDIEAGLSGGKDHPVDMSGRLQYRIYFPSSRKFPSLGAFYQYTGKDFITNAANPLSPDYSSQFGGTVGQKLPYSSYMNISSSYKLGHDTDDNTLTGSLTLLKSFGTSGSFSFTFSISKDGSEKVNWQGSLSFSFRGKDANRNLLYSHDLKEGSAGVTYNYNTPNKNYPDYSMSLEGMPPDAGSSSRAVLGATYSHDYFTTSLSQMYAVHTADNRGDTRSAQLSWDISSALLFTQGKFAVTQPVQDSFVMVVPDKEIEDELLTAATSRGGSKPLETEGGVITFSNISSYKATTIELGLPLTPPETVLEENHIEVFPAYHSGTLITARLKENIYLEGVLYTMDDEPLSLQAGEIEKQDEKESEPIYFFTDENGNFQIHDVSPGTYTLRMYAHEIAAVEIEIPSGVENPYNLQKINLPVVQH